MMTSPDIKLAAMPWANDMALAFVIAAAVHRAVGRDIRNHARENAALADRTAVMRTDIAPSIKLAVELEDPDFNPTDEDDPLLAIFKGANGTHPLLAHNCTKDFAEDSIMPATAQPRFVITSSTTRLKARKPFTISQPR